jgi:hypothetical protein
MITWSVNYERKKGYQMNQVPQGLMLFVDWSVIPKAAQKRVLDALANIVSSEEIAADAATDAADPEYESYPLNLPQTRKLWEGLDEKTKALLRAIAIIKSDEDGVAYIECAEAEKIVECSGAASFAKGPLAGLHRRLRTITGDSDSKLIFRWEEGDWKSYYIDHPQAIESLRTFLKIK